MIQERLKQTCTRIPLKMETFKYFESVQEFSRNQFLLRGLKSKSLKLSFLTHSLRSNGWADGDMMGKYVTEFQKSVSRK